MTSLVPAMRRFSVLEAAETIISLPSNSAQQKDTRRPSEQDMADSALLFLERRRSSDQSIGSIQPDLYRRRGSIVRHETKGKQSVARVQVQMTYDFSKSDFIVTLLEISNVMKLDEYSIAVSLSDTSLRRQSSKCIAGAPFHKETFKFALAYDDLLDKCLNLQLLGATRIGSASSVLGSTTIDLSSIDPSDDVILWTDIELHVSSDNLGELFVGIQYLPAAERLTITVHQAKGLPSRDALPNAVAKVYLLHDGKMIKKRKSGVRKNSANPVWNEALNFNIALSQLPTAQIEIHILDHDRIGNHKLIGQVSFGAGDRNNDRIWKDLLTLKPVNPRWIPLRML